MSLSVAAIDFHETRVWAIDADAQGRPEPIVVGDPRGYFWHLHAKAGNPAGTYHDDNASHHFVGCAKQQLAQQYFGTDPDRDFGDSRHGE